MSEWDESALAQLVTFQKGRKVETSEFVQEGYLAYLGASGIEGRPDGFGDKRFGVLSSSLDTLMLWDGERSGLVGFGRQGVVASTVARLTPNNQIEPKYLYFSLREKFDWIQHRRTGTGVPHVPKDLGRLLRIQYPKARIAQRKIAAILTSIDTATEKTEALITKYQQIKAGLMHDLFTRGVLPNGQLRPPRKQAPELYRETAIGWIPKDWHAKLIREVCLEVGDGVHYSVNRSPEGVPFLFVSCVRNGQIYWDDAARISPKTYLEISKKCKPYEGLVLLTAVGSYGHAAHVQTSDAFGFERNIAYLKSNVNAIESKYLYYWLTSDCARSQIERLVIGNAQKVLTLGNMEKIVVALPDKSEQLLLIEVLTASDSQLLIEHEKLHKFRAQKLGLMQDLLTGKVAVKVDTAEKEFA